MYNIIKKFFMFGRPEYQLGCFQNPEDTRDIHISTVQSPVELPPSYISEIAYLEVEDQKDKGTCVAQAISKLGEVYRRRRGVQMTRYSARSLYVRAKALDGIPNLQGTYPRVGANVLVTEGIATDVAVPDDNDLPYSDYMNVKFTPAVIDNMKENTLPAYVAVTPDFESIKQAIFQNGAVTGSLAVDTNWYYNIIKKVVKSIGYHYTLWYGYDEEGIYGLNSWSSLWGKSGTFYFKWEDYKDSAQDIIAFTNIPKKLMDEVKSTKYQFTRTMRLGDRSNDVFELQKRLDVEGIWPITSAKTGYYGSVTAEALYTYQVREKVATQSELDELHGTICGAKTITALNGGRVSKIDAWCEATKAHEGWFEGSRSYRNNNPGNIKHVGQKTATGKDSGGFCIFPSYEVGYNELRSMFIRVCTGKSAYYNPEMSLLDFYKVYAPSKDNNDPLKYASYVAKRLGVDITTKIKTLL